MEYFLLNKIKFVLAFLMTFLSFQTAISQFIGPPNTDANTICASPDVTFEFTSSYEAGIYSNTNIFSLILSDEEGSFLGIKTKKKTIQFAYEDDDKWLVDIPYDMKNFICLQKYVNYDECTEIIRSIFYGTPPEKIEGLTKINIMSETLNEIIKK